MSLLWIASPLVGIGLMLLLQVLESRLLGGPPRMPTRRPRPPGTDA